LLELNKPYLGDCLELMKDIDDNSIDMILCDLPYYKIIKEDWDNNWKTEKIYLNWIELMIIEYNRILKDNANIFLFTSRQYNNNISILLNKYFTEKRTIIWARKRNFNNTRGKSLSSGYEPISYYSKGNAIFNNIKIKIISKRKEYLTGYLKNGISLSDVWIDIPSLPHNSKEKLKHPTQKPLKLIERIINLGSNPGDLVLDNCAGSGTTGVACINTNRNFILMEKNPEYFKVIEERLKNIKVNQKHKFSEFIKD